MPTDRPDRAAFLTRYPALWVLFYLLLIDVGANIFFAYPADPRNVSPSKMQQYFEYGRSVEGKLARMTRGTDAESAPILTAGWLRGGDTAEVDPRLNPGRPTVRFYGMSHAMILANEVARLDDGLVVRFRAAPQATPTWTYTAFLYDTERTSPDVAVLTLMTNTIALSSTTSGTTMYFDGAYPYTWPRYSFEDGSLRSVDPPFMTVEDYRKSFFDATEWTRYREWLAAHDTYYDPLLFRRTPLDRSSLVRLLRRSYALSSRTSRQASVYDDRSGFKSSSEEVQVVKALVAEFARRARQRGTIPMVFIVNNLNTGDRAFAMVQPVLAAHAIPYLSSHELCAPDDPANYLPDSHFVDAKNTALARAMAERIHGLLAGRHP